MIESRRVTDGLQRSMFASRRVADGLLSLLALWSICLLAVVFAHPVQDPGRFPQQRMDNPLSLRDGQPIQDKLFIMKMMFLMERSSVARHGLSQAIPWTQEYVFEGDIILEKDQALAMIAPRTKRRRKRKMDTQVTLPSGTKKWKLPINYIFDGSHSTTERAAILDGIKHWEQQTCIKFVNNGTDRNKRIKFIRDTGCYSFVGKHSAPQIISIGENCTGIGIVAHEIGHSLGFWHEHARQDRDDYLTIYWDDIIPGQGHNFEKKTWHDIDNLAVPYDLGSLMHYSGETFAKASQITIRSKDPFLQHTMGQRQELSFYDVKLANLVYCNNICTRNQLQRNCEHDGYQDPLNCGKCRCADGLAGDSCTLVAPSAGNCGGTVTLSKDSLVHISSPGYPRGYRPGLRCYWMIESPPGTAINMTFKEPFMNGTFCDANKPYKACEDFVEVRFRDNLGLTGGRFCCNDYVQNITLQKHILSHSNHSLIIFKSFKAGDVGFRLQLSIESCGGCRNNITEPQVVCMRTVVKRCYQTWYVTKKLPGCVFIFYGCASGYQKQLVRRASLCYTEEPYCCKGYILSEDKKSCNIFRVSPITTPSTTTLMADLFSNNEVTENSNNNSSNNTGVADDQGDSVTWSIWGEWSQCSRSCGGCGIQTRSRSCPERHTCVGEATEGRSCNPSRCHSGMAMQICASTRNVTVTCVLTTGPCYRQVTTYRSSPSSCCCGYKIQNEICVPDTS